MSYKSIHLWLSILYYCYSPFGVLDADSTVVAVTDRSLHISLDGIIGGESGGLALLACEYKSNTWWQISKNMFNVLVITNL